MSEVIEKAKTHYMKWSSEADTSVPPELIKFGTATSKNFKSFHISNEVKLKFRKDCLKFLKALVQKLQEGSPWKYSFIRNVICLSPIFMVSEPEAAKLHFNAVVEKL